MITTIFLSVGYGGLSLSIEGPSKADIECTDNEDGACMVTYKPTEPGNYIVNVKFADEHVPGKLYNLLFWTTEDFTVKSGVKVCHLEITYIVIIWILSVLQFLMKIMICTCRK